ncbi:hypothetical protein FISHEDRAFT_66190 [Fistulina hepatica ATCC 64428]|uniref:Uncharacterized protein n=1 Tax=Fistulina hepatica ATCC 64428 TaxID=1128425 RepID=A0A0D7A8F1_9AGAR|nr:hypothetical protein FISHEDRAFT_66190 [Fistulina hepatica ATCC 64428]
MCPNSCMAYTGPFSDLEACSFCQSPYYDLTTGKLQEFHMILIDSAQKMCTRQKRTDEILADINANDSIYFPLKICDFHDGTAYPKAVQDGCIGSDDMLLMFSIDGTQLYQMKKSDCWIYIWVVLDYAADEQYTKAHIYPGGTIPGPNKLKHLNLFLFPGIHHLSAIQKEGLQVWDAYKHHQFISQPFFKLGAADGPTMRQMIFRQVHVDGITRSVIIQQ